MKEYKCSYKDLIKDLNKNLRLSPLPKPEEISVNSQDMESEYFTDSDEFNEYDSSSEDDISINSI